MFGLLLSTDEVRRLAPIAVVMAFFEAVDLWRLQMPFERKAGSPFLNYFIVSLQKNPIM